MNGPASPVPNRASSSKASADMTRRRVLEEELKASQARYEKIVVAMHGFMFTVFLEDGRPVRTVYYQGAEDVTGYTIAEYRANTGLWFSMIVEEDRPLVTRQIEGVGREKKTQSVDHRIRHKDGTIRWVRNFSVPTLDEQQRLVSYDGLITDITVLKETEAQRDQLLEETRRLAVRDSLTGLYCRRVLEDELNRSWQLGERRNLPLSLLMLDIDHLKVLNDTYGHPVGDQILVEASRLIVATVRVGDAVIRYGGDEIVVILPLTGLEEAHQVGTRVLDAFRQHIFCPGHHDLRTMVSIGVASGLGSAQPPAQILLRVDQALYCAKQLGRNTLCLSEPAGAASFILVGAPTPGGAGGREPDRASKGRILVVDDEEMVCSMVGMMLEKEHYSVAVALDAVQARSIAEKERGKIDVALVDLQLVGHTGLDVLKQLRVIDDTLIGVVMTGFATVDNSMFAMRHGAVDFIPKPITIIPLRQAITRAMQYRRLLQEHRFYQRHLEQMVAERSLALGEALNQVKDLRGKTGRDGSSPVV